MLDAKKSNLLINIIVLILAMMVSGLWSASLGKELSWDLAGYHFYNPFAILYGRINIDYWPPSAIQTYLPPTLDFFTYYLINHFSPQMTVFLLSSVHGINFALLFYIGHFFTGQFMREKSHQIYVAGAMAWLGIYAPTVFPFIGSFSNDNIVSIFVLIFVLSFLHLLKSFSETGELSSVKLFLVGFILGIAVGAKLTVLPYVVGAFFALLLLPIAGQSKLKWIVCNAIGVITGFFLTLGYWMWTMWEQYQNPFFPFLNKIFQSPYFPPINWLEQRFMPSNIIEAIFFPFYFSSIKRTAEFYFVDYRFLIIFILLALLAIVIFFKKNSPIFKRSSTIWFYLFFIFSYITWEINFSIMRYLGILQMLAPLFIFLLIMQLFQGFMKRIMLLSGIYFFILVSMVYSKPERFPYGNDFFQVELPALVQQDQNATVLIAYPSFAQKIKPEPNLYLIPFFPKSWRFSGIPFQNYHYELPAGVRDFVKRGPKQIFLLSSADYMPYMYQAAEDLHLKPDGACGNISSQRQMRYRQTILLCPVKAEGTS